MDTTFIVGLIVAALASGLFLLATFHFVKSVREGMADQSSYRASDLLKTSIGAIWGYMALITVAHFTILNLSHSGEPGIAAISNNALVVLDTIAKGVLLDLFESFDISLGHFEPAPDWAFAYAILVFVSRTFYSMAFAALAFVYATRVRRWWNARR